MEFLIAFGIPVVLAGALVFYVALDGLAYGFELALQLGLGLVLIGAGLAITIAGFTL